MVITIKIFGYLGGFSFFINNIFISGIGRSTIYEGLILSFGSKFKVNDNYIGLFFELLIRFIFSFSLNEMSDFLRMFGIR